MQSFRFWLLLLCCFATCSCKSVLGADEFESAKCTEGEKRCTGDQPERCTNGAWQAEAECEEQTCIDGACVGECGPGEKQCNGQQPQRCDDSSGKWKNDGNACVDQTCNAGVCLGICAPGQSSCSSDNKVQTCDAEGQWAPDMSCVNQTCIEDITAHSAVCVGECAPGKRCLGNTPQICNVDGKWDGSVPCESGQVCIAGACNCFEGDRRCFENRPQLCDASNQWVNDGEPCAGQTCDPDIATCSGVCEPFQLQCLDANTAQHCDTKGNWQTEEACALGCVASQCASCTSGEIRCAGNTPQTCSMVMQWQDEGPCINQTCLAGECQGECAFGTLRCMGKWPQVCDPVGTWRPINPCAAGESCYLGQCATSCVPGTTRCAGDFPQTCDESGAWQSNGAPCDTCIACNPMTGACNSDSMPLSVCNEPLSIAAGGSHTCAVFPRGAIKCWGWNSYGQLGLGDTVSRGVLPGEMGASLPEVDLGVEPEVAVIEISTGIAHTCARFSNGGVKCWGYNNDGELGIGDGKWRGDAPGEMGINLPFVDLALDPGITIAEIGSGQYHNCARASDGRIKCWGRNVDGQLGLGDKLNRGDNPGEMGINLPFVDLGLNPGVTVAEVSAGWAHTCARTSDGRVKCWGRNGAGQLGLGDQFTRGDAPNEMGTNLPFVELGLEAGVTVSQISAGNGHTCARTSDGRVKCWGGNSYGQLGLGDLIARGKAPNEMGINLPFVDLGLEPGVTVAEISAGDSHTCVRTSDGRAKCWGFNGDGQVGIGDANWRGDNPGEMGAELPFIDFGSGAEINVLRSGLFHICAMLMGGSVKCWGYNNYGQLGLFDNKHRGDQPSEMGDNLPALEL